MKIKFAVLFLLLSINIFAQKKFFTKNGTISFFSKTNVENIQATNNKALCVWDFATSKIEFSALMKGFEFAKALMQEHFNESYVESDKYPKATFKGIVENNASILLTTNGSYTVKIKGDLTLHGVTKPITTSASIKVNNGVVGATANFTVLLADYNISVPTVVSASISKTITISISVPAFGTL